VQFDSKKLRRRLFSNADCFKNNTWALPASSKSLTPSDRYDWSDCLGFWISVVSLDCSFLQSEALRSKRGKETIPLTSKEFAILELFLLHADDLVTRSDILEHVWEHHSDTGSNLVDVNRVRRKVDQNGFLKLIHTVRGTGYRLGMAEE